MRKTTPKSKQQKLRRAEAAAKKAREEERRSNTSIANMILRTRGIHKRPSRFKLENPPK